jgi:hypothetical protein
MCIDSREKVTLLVLDDYCRDRRVRERRIGFINNNDDDKDDGGGAGGCGNNGDTLIGNDDSI